MVAYFIRRSGDVCAVIKLHPDNREEVIQDGLSPIEAEILCVAKIEDIPRGPAQLIPEVHSVEPVSTGTKRRRTPKQLALKF
jgi:hypothetical protein